MEEVKNKKNIAEFDNSQVAFLRQFRFIMNFGKYNKHLSYLCNKIWFDGNLLCPDKCKLHIQFFTTYSYEDKTNTIDILNSWVKNGPIDLELSVLDGPGRIIYKQSFLNMTPETVSFYDGFDYSKSDPIQIIACISNK